MRGMRSARIGCVGAPGKGGPSTGVGMCGGVERARALAQRARPNVHTTLRMEYCKPYVGRAREINPNSARAQARVAGAAAAGSAGGGGAPHAARRGAAALAAAARVGAGGVPLGGARWRSGCTRTPTARTR